MEKINIAELLKDCPTGMELDCTMWDNVTFVKVSDDEAYPIQIAISNTRNRFLTKNGCFNIDVPESKCVIFPKGKTTWEGFVPPCKFKDGDIVYIKTKGYNHNEFIIIFKDIKNDHIHKHACFAYQQLSIDKCALCHLVDIEIMRFATEEEKEKLFKTIKDNGYKWNAETKVLEKLPRLSFKVGNRIRSKISKREYTIRDIKDGVYIIYADELFDYHIPFNLECNYELIPDKFDINTLVPFESKVLVRDYDDQMWMPAFWGKCLKNSSYCCYITTNRCYRYCIPYEGNEHLLGTKDNCDDYYKTW